MRASIISAIVSGLLAAAFVVLPLTGGPPVIRVAPFILAAAVVVALSVRPWKWTSTNWVRIADWDPSPRHVWTAAGIVALVLFWFVLTRFRSGEINAVDFTVYYDRPCFQTLLGRPLFIESADDPTRAYRSHFAVHAHWVMVPLAALYGVWATPLWLLALSVVAVVFGAIYILRTVQFTGGGGVLASAAAFGFVLNDNTARTLNYGFHPEVLYAWFIPWMLYAGLRRRWREFALAALACMTVKEDAFMFVFAVAVAIVMTTRGTLRRREWFYLAAPIAISILNLVVYYGFLVPRLSATGVPFYANYWSNYGPTATTALMGMLKNPGQVVLSALDSGFLTNVMPPYVFFPLIAWRWVVGILPVVLLYGASANDQLRAFGIYYAIPLVPFLALGVTFGARRSVELFVTNIGRRRALAAAFIIVGAILAGMSDAGYSLRPWRSEISAIPDVIRSPGLGQVVLVQSALYPHAGYGSQVQLLTSETLNDPRYAQAVLLLAPALDAYPLSRNETAPLYELPRSRHLAPGLIAVQRTPTP